MSKRTMMILWLAAAFTIGGQAQNVKIGFINTLQVLYGSEEGKVEIEKLNQFAAQKQQEIASDASELQKLQEQYASQQRTLNVETRSEMERSIQERDRRLKRLQEDIQLEYNQRRDKLLAKMSEKIREIINEYAPRNGYGVIFLRDQTQSYVDPGAEITQDIIRIYNERYPAAGQEGSESAQPAAPTPSP
jgi:outer membrane protein